MSSFIPKTNQPFYSPNKFESEQKDLIISQLKAENFELKQNERDYQEIAHQLKNLEHRYGLLHDEKVKSEMEAKNRSDGLMKTIANLRQENDNLKSQLTEKHIESQELRAENLAIKEIADHRTNDLQRHKSDLSQLSENNRRYYEEKMRLESELQSLRDEKRRLPLIFYNQFRMIHENEILNSNYEDLLEKIQEKEKVIQKITNEQDQTEQQYNQVKQEMDQMALDLKQKNENLRYTRMQYQEAQNYISQLQQDLEDIHKQKEKFKNESLMFQKNYQQEADTCMEMNNQIMQLDSSCKQQEKMIQDLRSEVDRLKQNHLDTLEQLEQTNKDSDIYKRNYEMLSSSNQELIEELERLQQQDESASIARQSKLKELKSKTSMVQKQSSQDLLFSNQSPYKRLSTKNKRSLLLE